MKLLFSVVSVSVLLVAVAYGQTSSTTTTTTGTADTQAATTSTTTTETTGTVTEFSPGASIVLSTGTGAPVTYRFHKSVTYVTPDGKVIEASKIKKNSKVRVHYLKEGDDMVVDRVIVTD